MNIYHEVSGVRPGQLVNVCPTLVVEDLGVRELV